MLSEAEVSQYFMLYYNSCAPLIFMLRPRPSKKREYIVLLLMSVGLSVDQIVSADYLEKYISQSLHISPIDWS